MEKQTGVGCPPFCFWSRNGTRRADRKTVSAETKSVIDRAKQIYARQLQSDLESQHMGRFVAIEPESGEYFLGDTSALTTLPFHHRDPFDRLLVAQAKVENMAIVSADDVLDAYGVQRLW